MIHSHPLTLQRRRLKPERYVSPPFYTEVNSRWEAEARTADSWSNVCVHMCSCAHMYTVCMHTMCVHACICYLHFESYFTQCTERLWFLLKNRDFRKYMGKKLVA